MFKVPRTRVIARTVSWLPVVTVLAFVGQSRALEALTVRELVRHCEYLKSQPLGVDGQYCIRYIQGFIDGAIETDERIMQGLESSSAGGLTERAKRTRLPRRGVYDKPGSLAGFCLEDPLPLGEVVETIVTDLIALDIGDTADSPARIAVDDSLRRQYPCKE